MTDCTSEIGASASAATWKPHDAVATRIPIVYQRDRNSASDVRTGRRASTGGDSTAPRCLNRKPTTDANAVARANSSPSWTPKDMGGEG